MDEKYHLNSQFDAIMDAATKEWEEKLIQETNNLKKNKAKIDNGSIQDHLREILLLSNTVRRRFNEVVFLEYRQILCYQENSELDNIFHLKSAMEQAIETMELKHRQLEMKEKDYDELTKKLK
ncbi:MAG TPA: hypothetical protein PKN87_08730 [Syntrophomonadaceae bacterium]|nr:hypothetical protein [Syntrophomonadaceae bacterium]HPR93788.1 hypothetical protein [Syntrophomonadaceae bacterium]